MKKCRITIILCVLWITSLLFGCADTPSVSSPASEPPATTISTVSLEGTGGDENSCEIHQFFYHAIDGDWEKQVGKEKMEEFFKTYTKTEDFNIVTFVEFCGITRERYIEVMGMTDVLDEKLTRHHPDCPYTNREFVDAIFGDAPELSERVFAADVFENKENAE